MAQTQPYGMVMNCRNQNGIYASTVRAQYIGINLVPHQGALGGRNPILPQALANPFLEGLAGMGNAGKAIPAAECLHWVLLALGLPADLNP